MKGEQVRGIAPPRDRLAADAEAQIDQIRDGSGGAMFAGNPLRIEQSERPGRGGKRQMDVNQAARSVGGVHFHARGILRCDPGREGGGAHAGKRHEQRHERRDQRCTSHLNQMVATRDLGKSAHAKSQPVETAGGRCVSLGCRVEAGGWKRA